MPWDGTELRLAVLDGDGLAGDPVTVAGGPEGIGVPARMEPRRGAAPDHRPDRLVEPPLPGGRRRALEALAPAEEEFGHPQWVFGLATYAFLPGGRIACIHGRGPLQRLGVLEADGTPDGSGLPFTLLLPAAAAGGRGHWPARRQPDRARAVVLIDPAGGGVRVLRSSGSGLDPGHLTVPEPIEFPTEGRPHRPRPTTRRPTPPSGPAGSGRRWSWRPCGGPTAGVAGDLHLSYQCFTSRGVAVVDVDYGGSTGYGRAYRKRLEGQWGIVDVDDCVAAAQFLAGRGDVDPARLAIRGGSAGGYTTLCALTFRDVFAAGASYYGVADVVALAVDTHKFESRYLDRLIGPWPQAEALYRERSPIHFTDRLSCPVILLQGLEDEVVPPAQAEMMAAALDAKAIPHAYLPFPGEQHGFRQAAHIRRALEAGLYFYSRVFGFNLADPVEPVPITHL
jgi:dipeptidyl aminopeptidase/acylaminoacyl peptidase